MTSEITLLFLNAGRRVELIRSFRTALADLGIQGRIVTTDINGWAPALYLGDRTYLTPRSRDSGFLERLCDICRAEKATLIIPLIDPDLTVLAQNRQAIEATGTKVLVSTPQVIATCSDKERTHDFLKEHGFSTPAVFSFADAQKQTLPLFIKPKDGSASLDTHKITSQEELAFFGRYVNDPLIQEYVEGVETTTDVFSDWTGKPLLAVPRRRLKVRAGEVIVGRVERDVRLEALCAAVASSLGTIGPINIQTITANDRDFIVEINPRFGGGCPLSIAAGAPFARWAIMMALGQSLPADVPVLAEGLTSMRFDDSFFYPAEQLLS